MLTETSFRRSLGSGLKKKKNVSIKIQWGPMSATDGQIEVVLEERQSVVYYTQLPWTFKNPGRFKGICLMKIRKSYRSNATSSYLRINPEVALPSSDHMTPDWQVPDTRLARRDLAETDTEILSQPVTHQLRVP